MMDPVRWACVALLAVSAATVSGSAAECTENGQRCAGAPGFEYVQYLGCCDPLAECISDTSMGWGRFCEVTSAHEKSGSTCYKENERCMGEEGYEYVDYRDCCSEDLWCAKDDTLGWGYHCKRKPSDDMHDSPASKSMPSYDDNHGTLTDAGPTNPSASYRNKPSEPAPSYDHNYGDSAPPPTKPPTFYGYYEYHPTKAPVVTTKSRTSHEYKQPDKAAPPVTYPPSSYGYLPSDTVDANGYYAGYYYGKSRAGQKPDDPFAIFGTNFGCASTGGLAMVDEAFRPRAPSETDIFVQVTIVSCSTDIDTFSNADAEALLASLCESARLPDPTAICRINAVEAAAAASPVRLAAETLNRQAVIGVVLEIQIRSTSTAAPAVIAALTVVIAPIGGTITLTATFSGAPLGTVAPTTVASTTAVDITNAPAVGTTTTITPAVGASTTTTAPAVVITATTAAPATTATTTTALADVPTTTTAPAVVTTATTAAPATTATTTTASAADPTTTTAPAVVTTTATTAAAATTATTITASAAVSTTTTAPTVVTTATTAATATTATTTTASSAVPTSTTAPAVVTTATTAAPATTATTTTASAADPTTTTAPAVGTTATTAVPIVVTTTTTTTTTVTITTTTAPATTTTAPSVCTPDADVVGKHNEARAEVGVTQMLTWDCGLQASAQAWANSMAANSNFAHSPESESQGGPGENIAFGFATSNGQPVARSTLFFTTLWYEEIANFQWGIFPDVKTQEAINNPSGSPANGQVGHYTQMVWDTTSRLGCGMATATNGAQYYCCQYRDAGNIIGRAPFPQP